MRILAIVIGCLIGGLGPAVAGNCPGNPSALGTSRTLTVGSDDFPRIGRVQYRNTLPLAAREVVITFDDGPLAPYTNRVLDALAAECVKATYFLVGRMARANPALVRRIYNDGHTIGTHSLSHPLTFNIMPLPSVAREVTGGIVAVQAAAGDPRAVSPFFRIPGLSRSRQVEAYLASRSLSVWSADGVADDWIRGTTSKDIVRKSLSRLEANGQRGVLLLHDINPATAMAVPALLRALKANNYRVVLAVPAGRRPPAVPEAKEPLVAEGQSWPRVVSIKAANDTPKPQRQRALRAAATSDITGSVSKKRKRMTVSATVGLSRQQ